MLQQSPHPQPATARVFRAGTLSAYANTVEHVMRAMRAHLSDPLSLEEMAEIACLSPFHFNRVFRTITAIPPGEFLAALRLSAAKQRLLTTSLSVTDICFDLGYTSLGAFSTRFKQFVGLSPLQLRQMSRELADDSIQSHLAARLEARRLAAVPRGGVRCAITVPAHFTGLIFAGLFPRLVGPGRPTACMSVGAPGDYTLGPVPDGRYYLMAAALPWSPDALTYLLPSDGALVGVSEQPVAVCGGQASATVTLALRPPRPTDPPILGVFPPLMETPAAARLRAAL